MIVNPQVSEKLKLAQETAVDIDRLRDGYRPAAARGAILFFALTEMALVNSMYQFSLASYLDVFDFSLRKSLPDPVLSRRLSNIMSTLTYSVYNYGCTGQSQMSPKLNLGIEEDRFCFNTFSGAFPQVCLKDTNCSFPLT